MYIILTKDIPVNKFHMILKYGIYKVYKEDINSYQIKSYKTDAGIWIKKEECKVLGGKPKFTFTHLAKCIKYIELIKWKNIVNGEVRKFDGKLSIEKNIILAFKTDSIFCSLFRKFKVDKGTDIRYCFCPLKPYEHSEWPIYKNKITGVKRRHCHMRTINGERKHMAEADIIKQIEAVSIEEIIEMLKQIKISKIILNKLYGYWFAYIWKKVREQEK